MNAQHTKTYDKLTSIKVNTPKHTIGEDERRSKEDNRSNKGENNDDITDINVLYIIIYIYNRERNSDRRELRPTNTSTLPYQISSINTYIYFIIQHLSHFTFPTISSNTIISTIHTTYNNTINRLDFRLSSSLSTDSFLDAEQTIAFISVLGSVVFIHFTNLGIDVASFMFIIPIVVYILIVIVIFIVICFNSIDTIV